MVSMLSVVFHSGDAISCAQVHGYHDDTSVRFLDHAGRAPCALLYSSCFGRRPAGAQVPLGVVGGVACPGGVDVPRVWVWVCV